MAFRDSARFGGAALAVLSLAALGTARPASAQEIERQLAGIRLGMRSTSVLAKYGNPNDVVIGDIGIRQAPGPGGAAAGPGGGPAIPGAGASPGPGGGGSLPGFGGGAPGGGFGGAPAGFPGAPGGMMSPRGGGGATLGQMGGPGGAGMQSMGMANPEGGFGTPGFGQPGGGGFGGLSGAGGAGGFGQTVSPLANEQEVTWVYNRKVGNNVVSYEFLIGPAGNVSQIRVSGYKGGDSMTARHISLGAQYKEVVKTYGYPEDHEQVGNVLVVSYKQKAHVSFQLLNQSGQTDAYHSGYKVIAITIAQVD